MMVVDVYLTLCPEARPCTMGPLQILREGQICNARPSSHVTGLPMHPLRCDVDFFFGTANVPLFTEAPSFTETAPNLGTRTRCSAT